MNRACYLGAGVVQEGMNVTEILAARDRKAAQGPWVPACGGAETPFLTRSGHRLLYCWQPSTGRHAYLNCDTDLILDNDEAVSLLGLS